AMAAMLLARESSRSRPWPLPQADEQAGNQKKNAAAAAFPLVKLLQVRSARGGLARRLGGGGGRLRGRLALRVAPGPERGDVGRAQRSVPEDLDAAALLAEGGEIGGDRLAGQVAADVLPLARARGQVRGAVGLAGHGISFAGGSPLQRLALDSGMRQRPDRRVAGPCSPSCVRETRSDAPHVRGVMGDGKCRDTTRTPINRTLFPQKISERVVSGQAFAGRGYGPADGGVPAPDAPESVA